MGIKVAKLDAAGVFQGVGEVAKLTDLHLPLDQIGGECDLPPGKYRWDRQRKTFVPLRAAAVAPARDVPTLERAVYALIKRMDMPPEDAQRWADWYETTIEAQAAAAKKSRRR